MKIKIGKSYRTREGNKVTITNNDGHSCYPFDGSNGCSYTPRGSIWDLDDSPSDDDLVAEWPEHVTTDADGWIEWKGGECPVDGKTMVEVRGEDRGYINGPVEAGGLVWSWNEKDIPSIKFYRLAQPAKELPVKTVEDSPASALQTQVAGDHYRSMKIQPIEYIHANGIGFSEGTAIAYLSRWREKGGLEDLRKAAHTIELLIELEGRAEK